MLEPQRVRQVIRLGCLQRHPYLTGCSRNAHGIDKPGLGLSGPVIQP